MKSEEKKKRGGKKEGHSGKNTSFHHRILCHSRAGIQLKGGKGEWERQTSRPTGPHGGRRRQNMGENREKEQSGKNDAKNLAQKEKNFDHPSLQENRPPHKKGECLKWKTTGGETQRP